MVKIAKNCHIITNEHLKEDGEDEKIGTTKKGTGPAYRNKYNRSGIRARQVLALGPYLVDLYEEFHSSKNVKILCEGAQGFELDIDWGDYPYVTSSHCTSASALLNGIPPNAVRHVWGVGKVYDTYVGQKTFEPDDDIFSMLRLIGEEFGATTGRPRQCNWLDIDRLIKSININGITHLVLNKVDVLEKLNRHAVYDNKEIYNFDDGDDMRAYIMGRLETPELLQELQEIYFSGNKNNLS